MFGYLIEGVRQFAIRNGCSSILIPYPMEIMKEILLKLGFKENVALLEKEIIGVSCAPQHDCKPSKCYIKNTEKAIHLDRITTVLFE